jgi:hypothetical protein
MVVRSAGCYKLYINPLTEQLPDAFRAILEALSETGASAFKIGKDV